jgi:hypothetical protein
MDGTNQNSIPCCLWTHLWLLQQAALFHPLIVSLRLAQMGKLHQEGHLVHRKFVRVVVLPRQILVSTYAGFIHDVSIAHPNKAAARPLQQHKK